jgi:TATA-binding protein-associated factor
MLVGDWITQEFARLLFQNLIFEERADIRDCSITAWRLTIQRLAALQRLEAAIFEALPNWFSVVMNPIGVSIDPELLFRPVKGGMQLHNVDKPMLIQDLSLVSEELVLRGRIAASKALSFVLAKWPAAVSLWILRRVNLAELITDIWYRCNTKCLTTT